MLVSDYQWHKNLERVNDRQESIMLFLERA